MVSYFVIFPRACLRKSEYVFALYFVFNAVADIECIGYCLCIE